MNDLLEKIQTGAPHPDFDYAQALEDRLVAELMRVNTAAQGDSDMLAQTTLIKPQRPFIQRTFASPLMLAAALLIIAAATWVFGPLGWSGNGHVALGPTQPALAAYPTITPENAARLQRVDTLGNGGVFQAAYSPDGETLALAGTLGIWLYDADDVSGNSRLLMTESAVTAVAYSPDGTMIASGHANGEIHLWNATSGEAIEVSNAQGRLLQMGHRDRVNALAFSPDGAQLASASGSGDAYSENAVQLWNLERGAQVWADRQWDFPVWSVAFSEDGRALAVDSGNAVNLRVALDDDEASYRTIERTQSQPAAPDSLFLPDDRLIFNDGTALHFYTFDSTEDKLHLADDGTVEIGTTEPGNAFFGHVSTIATNASGTHVIAGTTSGGVYGVDAATREVTTLREPDGAQTLSVAVSSTGQVVAAFNTGEVSVVDLESGEAARQIGDFDLVISKVMAYGDNALMTIGAGAGVRLWDLNSLSQMQAFTVDNGPILESTISPDGSAFVYTTLGTDRTLGMNDSATYVRHLGNSRGPEIGNAALSGLVFSHDGQWIASVAQDYSIYLTPTESAEFDYLYGDDPMVRYFSPAFSPDGERLVVGRNGAVEVISLSERRLLTTFTTVGEDNTVARLWYSPDSSQLLATVHPSDGVRFGSSSTTLLLLDAETGEVLYELTPAPAAEARNYQRTWQAVFSPDGALVAGLTTDTSGKTQVDLWDTATGERLETPGLGNVDVASLDFNSEGNLLITGGWDGLIRLYAVTE